MKNSAPTRLHSLGQLRRVVKVGDAASGTVRTALKPIRSLGFPYRKPMVPTGVVVPADPSKLGANFETGWARSSAAKAARAVITNGPIRAFVKTVASPQVVGLDRLADLQRLDETPPVIFAPNHHSHVDTPLIITVVPEPWRSTLVVAAAADYFFDTRVKGALAALTLNAFPIDREITSRKSSDELRRLIDEGWSLVIYPEGGRSPDGWGQEFKGGAAYLAYLLAAVHLGLTLLTDFPAGAFKLIPLRVHGWVELCVAPLLKISYSVTLYS